MSSSTIEKSVTIYRGDDEVLLFSGVGPVTGLITLQVAAVFGGATLLQSTSVDGAHGADHAAGKLAFPITAGQSASLPSDSMLAYDVKIVDAGVTRSPFFGIFRVNGSITQTEFPVGMSANDVLSLLSNSSDSSKGAGLIGVLQSFWSGVGFAGPFRLQGLLQWLYSKITPRIDPQTGGKLVKTVGTAGAIGESAVSESSGVLDAAGYLEGGNPFLGEHTTDELPEGSSNRYYTAARENAKANVDLTNVLNTDFYDKAVSAGAVGGGVASFNSRTGAVTPQLGDYSASQVSATETGDLSGTTVQAQLEDLDSRVGSNLWGPYPGRTTMLIEGARESATPAFPWHPWSQTRVFSQAEAPAFFSFKYGQLVSGTDGGETAFAINNAQGNSGTTAFAAGSQCLSVATSVPEIQQLIDNLYTTAKTRAYRFEANDCPPGNIASRDLQTGTVDSSTDIITFSFNHLLPTGWPVSLSRYPSIVAGSIYGVRYYARALTDTTISLHPTEADAQANTNKLNFTSGGTVIVHAWLAKAELTVTLDSAIGHIPAGVYDLLSIEENNSGNHNFVIAGTASSTSAAVSGDIRFSSNRIAGSTTTFKWHAREDSTAMSMRSDSSLVNGLERPDQSQAHHHRYAYLTGGRGTTGISGSIDVISTSPPTSGYLTDRVTTAISDGTNGTPRTGPRTRPRSVIVEPYVYVGANTLS